MPTAKRYLNDKLMLLLMSSNVFLAFLCGVLLFLRLSTGDGESYIVEYRSNLGIGAFKVGSAIDVMSFAAYTAVIAAISIVLSVGIYRVRRMLAALVLGAGIMLLLMAIIVSNALMVLR